MSETARVFAMTRRCRRKGGGCPCDPLECLAERELKRLRHDAAKQLGRIEHTLEWLNHEPSTVRDDWKRPEKPDGDYQLTVYQDDAWYLHWHSETEDIDYIEITGDAAWPFVQDTAWAEDWERLGVAVV